MKTIENTWLFLKKYSIHIRLISFILFSSLIYYILKYASIDVMYQYVTLLVTLAIIIPVTISKIFKIRVFIVNLVLLLFSSIYKYYPMDSFLLFDVLNKIHKMNYNNFINSANIIFIWTWVNIGTISFIYVIYIISSKIPRKENNTPILKKEYFNLKLLQNLIFTEYANANISINHFHYFLPVSEL